ncbi:PhzF family phenazine biosynthesis protein [Bernardetia sp.]|uniref:PhzF family phenazine biosynthesis protein n=1 Tax=Bernardetia sp. TaxID=1937974 RepID=UPI0025BACCB8|nr:PhzF family phenazine biosynthesis isomerase [Bernardetia sp.]
MSSSPIQTLPFFQVDAFAPKPFSGNPAAVFLCDETLTNEQYLNIAGEMYLPETTFLRPLYDENIREEDKNWQTASLFEVRWFMIKEETNLCGHATLAAAHVVFEEIKSIHSKVTFRTRSGDLLIKKEDFEGEKDFIKMQFPVEKSFESKEIDTDLLKYLGISKQKINSTIYYPQKQTWILELENREELESLEPNFEALVQHKYQFPVKKVGVTTKGSTDKTKNYDFTSRCFCPWIGINEDALSAVSHGLFAKYWQTKLHKSDFFAYQASARGGEIHLQLLEENQVLLIGKGITTLEGNARI